jgi:hypothetical protein
MVRYLKPKVTFRRLVQILAFTVALNVTFSSITPASAAPGDILVADLDAGGLPQTGPGRVYRVNPCTGARTAEYSGFQEPSGVAVAANGDILVADQEAFGGNGGIFRVNPVSGVPTPVSSGGNFRNPAGVALAANGDILVVDIDAASTAVPPDEDPAAGGVIRVTASGTQTLISSGPPFLEPVGIAIDPRNGEMLVADLDAPGPLGEGPGRIFRLSPNGGTPINTYAVDGSVEPSSVAVAANGDIFIADAEAFGGVGGIFRLNAAGQKIREYRGANFLEPSGVALSANGVELFVADQDAFGGHESGPGGVLKVDSITGTQTVVASGAPFVNPSGIAVEPGAAQACPGAPGTGTPPRCAGREATLTGTDGKNSLAGTSVNDVIVGLGGNDVVRGLAGADRLCGGRGKDKVSGGTGKDRLFGERGNDILRGGPGADRLVGGKGRDTCIGGPGRDRASGCEVKIGIP